MSATDGLCRGADVYDTGKTLEVPVGQCTLGRIFNVLGQPVDGLGEVESSEALTIHREAPSFTSLDTEISIFETV